MAANNFTFADDVLAGTVSYWKEQGWPVEVIEKDHYRCSSLFVTFSHVQHSAKILQDNAVFTSIKYFGHEWKYDAQEGLLVLAKKSPSAGVCLKVCVRLCCNMFCCAYR